MKNIELSVLLFITVLFTGLMVGVMIGRIGNDSAVKLSEYDKIAANEPSQTVPYRSETVGKININIASAEELSMLPGIGITYATRIVEYRAKHGQFLRIEELTNISGIGEKRFESIKEYITVGG